MTQPSPLNTSKCSQCSHNVVNEEEIACSPSARDLNAPQPHFIRPPTTKLFITPSPTFRFPHSTFRIPIPILHQRAHLTCGTVQKYRHSDIPKPGGRFRFAPDLQHKEDVRQEVEVAGKVSGNIHLQLGIPPQQGSRVSLLAESHMHSSARLPCGGK